MKKVFAIILFLSLNINVYSARNFIKTSNQYLLNESASPCTSAPCTIAVWFNLLASGSSADVPLSMTIQTTTSFAADTIFVAVGTDVKFNSFYENGIATTLTAGTLGQWHQGTGVFTSDTLRDAYIDGGSKGSDTLGRGVNPPDSIMIGNLNLATPVTGDAFDGQLAIFTVWNVVINSDEISELASGIWPMYVRNQDIKFMVPVWGTEDPELDYSGQGIDMTVTGATQITESPPFFFVGGGN